MTSKKYKIVMTHVLENTLDACSFIAPKGGYCAHDLKFDVRPMFVCLFVVSFALDPVFGPVKVVKLTQRCI